MKKILLFLAVFIVLVLAVHSNALLASIARKTFEANDMAKILCKMVRYMNMIIVPIAAIMLVIIGVGCFQGKASWIVFFTFAIGLVAFRGAENLLNFTLPSLGLGAGCSCKKETIVGYDHFGNAVTESITISNSECNDYDFD